MKFRPLFLAISSTMILVSLFSIFKWGFRPSIDFAGGSVWEVKTPNLSDQSKITIVFDDQKIPLSSVSPAGDRQYLLKFANIDQAQKKSLEEALKKADTDFSELRFETLGPTLG